MMRSKQLKIMPAKRVILVGCIALMAVGVVLTTHKITSLSDRLTSSQSKLVWYMLSLSKEYDALMTLLARYQGGKSSFDNVAVQHEILWSRFPVAINMAREHTASQPNPRMLLNAIYRDLQASEASFYALRFSTHNIGDVMARYRQQRQQLEDYFAQTLSLPGNGYREHTRLLNQLGQLTTMMTLGMMAVGATVLLLIAHDAKRYYKLAREDQLTGLNNRHWLFDALNHRFATSTEGVAILVIDLDGFKAINDTHGHDVGDVFLRTLAKRFADELPSHAVIARLGGDEFAAIIPYQEANMPGEIATTLVNIAQRQSVLLGHRCKVSASIGLAFGQNNISGERLLRYADTAMYAAKHGGKNQYRVYHDAMQASDHRLHSRGARRPALESDDSNETQTDQGDAFKVSLATIRQISKPNARE
ncbi:MULTISPECIES: GGDEF domain-containing protein [unclassified Salinivibrio]|uniref:GGDEF domain-containing protein n=1 Tax=unclassified Salinivibrio TaxID=2636825 RepID=UPI00061475BC|nr:MULTISPECIES: GGDEF domain-containing protein [unclassified Salinivibrio]KKA45981.1 hypothetical protein WN56_02370 [Salinivibrio sp. KP-1]OOE77124.1 GGDEF domain-containing protein [Salinivibrio sp. ML290]